MTNYEMNQHIADFIGSYCSRWNISIANFSEKCNIPYMTMKRILACNVQKIDVYTISRIAQFTQTPIIEILGADDENLELYKRLSRCSFQEKQIITQVIDILEKIHISGKECREIPFADLDYDRKSYLLSPRIFTSNQLDFSKMERISFHSSFTKGFHYFGFRLPNDHLHPLYHKGDILLAVNDEPAHGDIGAFVFKDEGLLRIVFRKVNEKEHETELLPLNGLGKKYTVNTDNILDIMHWIPLGIVVGRVW